MNHVPLAENSLYSSLRAAVVSGDNGICKETLFSQANRSSYMQLQSITLED